MPLALLLLITAVLAASALVLPPRYALSAVIVTIVLVPGSLPLPGLPGVFTIHRLVFLAALVGVLRRVLIGRADIGLLNPSPIGSRFAVALGVLAITGVALATDVAVPDQAARNWEALGFQLIAFLAVLALAREVGTIDAGATALVSAVAVSAVIAVAEHVTKSSYTRYWYFANPSLLQSDPAQPLATRAGQVRVRGAADFTLAFAWCTAACLPLIIVVATRARARVRGLVLMLFPLALLVIYWTYSRSVVAPALVAVAVVIAIAVRVRTVQVLTITVLFLGVLVVLADPHLARGFAIAADTGSIDVRVQRLPAVAALAATTPYHGLGFGGLAASGYPTTDSTYLLGYAEAGVVGLAALATALVMGVCAAGAALRADDRAARALALAYFTGALLLVGGAFTFDAFTTPSSSELFWTLVALGVALAERSRLQERARPLPWLARFGALLVLLVIGLALRAVAPTHVARTWQFDTIGPYLDTLAAPSYTGVQLLTTVCQTVEADTEYTAGVKVTCQPYGMGPGQGVMRLQAPNATKLEDLAYREVAIVRNVPTLSDFRLDPRQDPVKGSPTALHTAPAWLVMGGVIALLPTVRRRRV